VYGISIKLEPSKLYEIISTEAQGHLDVQALARGLLQMPGRFASGPTWRKATVDMENI
jgi:hypothetical protein